jgi:hypothetical protein
VIDLRSIHLKVFYRLLRRSSYSVMHSDCGENEYELIQIGTVRKVCISVNVLSKGIKVLRDVPPLRLVDRYHHSGGNLLPLYSW